MTTPVVASQNIVVPLRDPGGAAGAFQKNAFFSTGFQTSFSQDAFQKCSFSSTGFQVDECEAQNGRSGYWRLFFMQMQEDALKKQEETKKQLDKKVPPVVAKTAVAKPTKKQSIKVVPITPELPKFKLNPIVTTPSVYEQLADLPSYVFSVAELQSYRTNAIISFEAEKAKRRRQARRRAAALLLLAA